jgi:chemotaxis protein MotB
VPAYKLSKNDNAHRVNPNAWMVTFSDLIMILITFFVLLLTMKSMDNNSLKEMFRSDHVSRGPVEIVGVGSEEQAAMLVGDRPKPVIVNSAEELKKALEAMEGIESGLDEKQNLSAMRDMIEITEDNRGVIVTLDTDHLFGSGEAEIRPDRLFILDNTGKLLRHAANAVLIMGHTDNVPIRGGPFGSNWDLSFYRALSVFFYLSDGAGLDAGNLAVGGYGDRMPRYPNDSAENRAKNRRVEFILKKSG